LIQPEAALALPALVGPSESGLWSWITSVDHKRIGIPYGVSAELFFALGGLGLRPNTLLALQAPGNVCHWHFVDIVWILIFTLGYLIPD
jgi:heme/copper-type cytochrome/quinol oxidase subunit 1